MEKLKDLNGVLSLIAVSEDFSSDYAKMHIATVTLIPPATPEVLLCSEEHKNKSYLPARISIPSLFSLKRSMNNNEGEIIPFWETSQIYNVVNTVFSFFDNEPILGFCDQYLYDSRTLFSSIVFKRGNEILCSEISLGDLLCMETTMKLPIYVRKDIVDKHGVEYENTINPD